MSDNERDEQHGRLGRLFAALVGTETGEAADAERPVGMPPAPSRLDLDGLSRTLASSPDPMRALSRFVSDVRRRTAQAEAGAAPSALETYLAERLEEAGVADAGGRLSVRVVRPRTSDLFYLRIDDEELSWSDKLRVMRVEAALNGALLAASALEDADDDLPPSEKKANLVPCGNFAHGLGRLPVQEDVVVVAKLLGGLPPLREPRHLEELIDAHGWILSRTGSA